ncbi:unnamed protein product [Timema podura]|uniref:C2H2-type domain-containing protein n=1 Tax=Timema podura TaxID=61482 RepID=A0ABN7PSA0_TIMPD|nr:unnamed protein product [Timema podura]
MLISLWRSQLLPPKFRKRCWRGRGGGGFPSYPLITESLTSRVCDAGFLTATRLKRHEYIHTRDTSYDDRPFSCTVCTKAFRRKDTLYSHMKVHTTERLHSCSDCGRTFKKSNDRNRHRRNNCKMSLANGQPPTVYSCPICKKSFNSSASASNHLAFVHVLNKNSTEENRVPIGTDEPIISSL